MTQAPNKFIWYELMTTDRDAAEAFYRAIVGWNMADAGQPRMHYTILSAGDRGMGGLMKLPDEACEKGARPGWVGYIGVPDTDAGAKRIVEAGGALHMGPDDIPNVAPLRHARRSWRRDVLLADALPARGRTYTGGWAGRRTPVPRTKKRLRSHSNSRSGAFLSAG